MSQKLERLIILFQQLEVWDMQGRRSVSNAPSIIKLDLLPESDTAVETPLSRTVNQFHELTTQIRELAENEQGDDILNGLFECLQHSNWVIRLQAIEALGYTRSIKAINPLITVMQSGSDFAIKAAAAQSLGIIGSPLATPALVEFLQSQMLSAGESKVRWMSAQALSFIADPNAVDVLVETFTRDYGKFEEQASDIREAARDALVSIGGEVVVDRLISLWVEPTLHPVDPIDENMRLEIITALSQIEHPNALDFLLTLAGHQNPMMREAVMMSMAYAQDPRVVDMLTNALTDVEPSVREAAKLSLSRLGKY